MWKRADHSDFTSRHHVEVREEVPQLRTIPKIDPATLPNVEAELGIPPLAAPPTGRSAPANVIVNIEVKELEVEIADGAKYVMWTYGGTVPGPMIRVRRGDHVQLHLKNHPTSTMPHNIDLHAVTGPRSTQGRG